MFIDMQLGRAKQHHVTNLLRCSFYKRKFRCGKSFSAEICLVECVLIAICENATEASFEGSERSEEGSEQGEGCSWRRQEEEAQAT